MKKMIINITFEGEKNHYFAAEENGKIIVLDYASVNSIKEFEDIKTFKEIEALPNADIHEVEEDKSNMLDQVKAVAESWNKYYGSEEIKILGIAKKWEVKN